MRAGDVIETFTTEQLEANLGANSADTKKRQLAELAEAKAAENEVARAEASVSA